MVNHRHDTIVLGIGNPNRGDDAAGLMAARLLRGMLPAGTADCNGMLEVIEHDGEAASLLARLDGVRRAFLIDACVSAGPHGTMQRFDVSHDPLPRGRFGLSTHSLGLADVIELGRALGQLPSYCIVYAIEGSLFQEGAPLSPEVAAAVGDVVSRLRSEILGPSL